MESKSTFLILIIVITVLALALAFLVGYLFIVQDTPKDKVDPAATEVIKTVPKKEELFKIQLYEGKRIYNLKNVDPEKNSMMQVALTLECYKQLKRDKKVIVEEIVASYTEEIQELVVRFFMTKVIDDVKNVEVMDKAKKELITQINGLLNEGEKNPEDIIYKVIFSEWLFQ